MKVLLVHGLGRSPASMAVLAMRIRAAGYDPLLFGYVAALRSFDHTVDRLATRLSEFGDTPFAVVTHSLGAVLIRCALQRATSLPSHLIMLAPPNQPPRLARWAIKQKPFRWFTGDSGARLASASFYDELAVPSVPYTIVAGNRGPELGAFPNEPNDGIVAVAETRLRDEDEIHVVNATHTFIMNRSDVGRIVTDVLDGIQRVQVP